MAKRSYTSSAVQALYEAVHGLSEVQATSAIKRFVAILKEKGRLDLAPKILAAYAKLASEKADVVKITTAEPMDKASAAALRKALGIEVELSHDPSLVAGAIIRRGELLLDASVRRKLELLKLSMTA